MPGVFLGKINPNEKIQGKGCSADVSWIRKEILPNFLLCVINRFGVEKKPNNGWQFDRKEKKKKKKRREQNERTFWSYKWISLLACSISAWRCWLILLRLSVVMELKKRPVLIQMPNFWPFKRLRNILQILVRLFRAQCVIVQNALSSLSIDHH